MQIKDTRDNPEHKQVLKLWSKEVKEKMTQIKEKYNEKHSNANKPRPNGIPNYRLRVPSSANILSD